MAELGRLLLLLGGIAMILGAALLFAGRLNLPIGRLPGDIAYRGKNTVVYFPLATSILVSIILSLIFWLIGRGRH
jgi:Protein of unknown function (DUF2905)